MMKEYLTTVITPYHNTKMDLFLRTYNSLLNQSIGFKNIEWVIVLHNCEERYISDVNKLLKDYDNVVIKELKNDAKTASSPRNYGLQFVTSPYIMFLDSDDTYYPRTIEVCLEKMNKHSSDIVIFRMAYLKQNDLVTPILTDKSLWNPLKEEVVLNGREIYCEELYSTIQFSGSNKMFTKDLIINKQIKFDEKITMAEDAYFVLLCYSKAKKIVVLPQFVGHCYFLNSASSVQSMNKSSEELLGYLYGFKLMFDLLIDSNAYYNHFIITILYAYIIQIYSSRDFTLEDWKTLQDNMRPYVQKLTVPPVNKHFTKEQGELIYEFVRHNILDEKKEDDLEIKNFFNGEANLAEVIRNNKDTDFGKYYEFENITSIEDFQKKVPLYDHKSYSKLIDIQTTVGEKNVYANNTIVAYAYDFNESNELRTIPVASEVYDEMGNLFKADIIGQVTFLMMESLPKGRTLNDDTYNDSVTGIMSHSGLGKYTLGSMDVQGEFTSPFSLIFPKKIMNTEYLNLLFALRNPKVTQIFASNTWVVFGYIECLLTNIDTLCDDIANGTVSVEDVSSIEFVKKNPVLSIPNKTRAEEIRKALKNSSLDNMLNKIWPDLKRIIAKHDGMYQLYTDKLNKYIGNWKLYPGDLITPFGILAKYDEQRNQYKLNVDKAFFEFAPANNCDKEKTVLISDIKCDEIYEIILTNNYGIYRMHTNIFIKPIEANKELLYFVECEKPLLNGNKIVCSLEEIYSTLKVNLSDNLWDFYCYFDKEKKKIVILLELEKEMDTINIDHIGSSPCEIQIIEKETRLLRRDMMRNNYMAPADCFPPIRNLENKEMLDMLKNWQHIR